MDRLSKPLSEVQSHYDAVVVGSGYGGGIAASRLTRMGYKTALLERGDEMHPGEYPDTPEKAVQQSQVHGADGSIGSPRALFDLHVGKDMNVLVGCGLGGTSLINANVSIEPDPRVFEDPTWPAGFHDDDLAEGFRRARAMLRPVPFPEAHDRDWPTLNKLVAMERSADAMGAELTRPPINVTFQSGVNAAGVTQPPCNLCGDCCSGCNVGAKNTVLMNYLPDAVANGAEIYCGAKVVHVSKGNERRFAVHYQPTGFGRDVFGGAALTVEADIVVLAGGTLGSTEILLRSREQGLPLSNALGTRFSGNGDVLAFAYNCDSPIDGIGMGWKAAAYDWHEDPLRPVGPTITGLIDLRGTDQLEAGMVIEEGSIPGGVGKFLPSVMAVAAHIHGIDTDSGDLVSESARELESLTLGPYRGAVNHTQTFLIMSHDGAGGQLALDKDRLQLNWSGVGDKPCFKSIGEKIRDATAALGGTYVPNPIWSDLVRHELITVHPLGGCPMSTDASNGVVDQGCKVFASANGSDVHDGLYVCDGSVMPRSLGVNPLLTISAVSERAMIRLARENSRTINLDPPKSQSSAMPSGEQPIGLRFTEKMAGTIRHEDGKDYPASFVLTIIADDLDKLVSEPTHEAKLVGTITVPPLSPDSITVEQGSWNLFISDPQAPDTRLMTYHMPFEVGGQRYLAVGEKSVHDDPGFDIWADTTRLALKIHGGADETAPVVSRGTLVIAPADFIRQIRTMTIIHAPDLLSRAKALARFGLFFGGVLFESFGGPFAVPQLFNPDAVRMKRPLRVGLPEVEHFTTVDGKVLRFTRYRGGDKGPVILSHGLGVSSLIFSIDTIDTNLLEYLYAAGYDCWLLDYRASIDLPYATEQFTADDVAEYDYPAAIQHVCSATGCDSVQMVAHCYGAMSFAMAMLSGLQGVRSAVISQIAAHADVPLMPQRMLAYLRAPAWMSLAGATSLDAGASTKRNPISRLIDGLLGFYPYHSEDRTLSATSRRITALYGPLYEITQLNQATMDALPEMFGKANIKAFRQLSKIARCGHVVRASSGEPYVTEANLRNFAIPTLFVHGELNRAFLPSGTRKTMEALARVNGSELYERCVIAGTGHIDSIFGRNAARDVFPRILDHLNRNAKKAAQPA